jgi:hypothetical protein
MEARGINRKSALRFLNKDAKSCKTKTATAPAVDVKQAAACPRLMLTPKPVNGNKARQRVNPRSDASSSLCGRQDFGNGDRYASCPAPSQT